MAIFVLSILLALVVSATCSLLESTLLSLTPTQLAEISRRYPSVGRLWSRFKQNIEQPIAVILILNTAAHTIGATLAGDAFKEVFDPQYILLFSVVFTFAMLQFTEILPKTLGVYYNRTIAVFIAWPLDWLIRILKPVLWIVQLINRPFERRRPGDRPLVTHAEIRALAEIARMANQIDARQERIITAAWQLSRLPVRDVMVPVEEMVYLSADDSLSDAILKAHLDPHTRFPIVEDNDPNRVLGYVNFKEMIYRMRTNPNDQSLRGIIRPVHFVSPDEDAADLLKVFVDQHMHMAIVRDEQGRTLGLVTLEDIIEELVGELEDELERLPKMFHPLSGDTWMVGGGVTMQELQQRLGVKLTDPHGTVSAWLIRRFGRIPKANEIYSEAGLNFVVRRIRRSNIFEILITKSRSHPAVQQAEQPQPSTTPPPSA